MNTSMAQWKHHCPVCRRYSAPRGLKRCAASCAALAQRTPKQLKAAALNVLQEQRKQGSPGEALPPLESYSAEDAAKASVPRGKQCSHRGCGKAAQGVTAMCKGHSGGKRCSHKGCGKAAVHGGTVMGLRHGGGMQYRRDSCAKSATSGDAKEEAQLRPDEGKDPEASNAVEEQSTKEGAEGAPLPQNAGELEHRNFTAALYDEQEYNTLRNAWLVEQPIKPTGRRTRDAMYSGVPRDRRVRIASSGLSHNLVSNTLERSSQATTDEERMKVLIVLRALQWWETIGAAQRNPKPPELIAECSSSLDPDVVVVGSPSEGVPAPVATIDLTEGGWDLEEFMQEQIERHGLFLLRTIKPDPDQEPGPATKRAKHVVKTEPRD